MYERIHSHAAENLFSGEMASNEFDATEWNENSCSRADPNTRRGEFILRKDVRIFECDKVYHGKEGYSWQLRNWRWYLIMYWDVPIR